MGSPRESLRQCAGLIVRRMLARAPSGEPAPVCWSDRQQDAGMGSPRESLCQCAGLIVRRMLARAPSGEPAPVCWSDRQRIPRPAKR